MKALIIDDEKPVRDCIQLLVDWKEYGVDMVFEAEDGYEAIQIITAKQPDLILTDIRMPVTDGLQLMDFIYHNAGDCKVIAISGYTDYEYVRQIFLQGGIDYILKPIQPQKLCAALKTAVAELEKSRLGASPVFTSSAQEIAGGDYIYYQIKYYIDENYPEKLSLTGIAALFHVSEAHLSRKFKGMFGVNIVQYIKSVRISHAKKYLIQSNRKISEIAATVGYDDEKYFSRIFRDSEQLSPNDYRQKYQNRGL